LVDVALYEERKYLRLYPFTSNTNLHKALPPSTISAAAVTRASEFCWKLWHGDDAALPKIDIHETFTGPEVTIEAKDVEQFCVVVGN